MQKNENLMNMLLTDTCSFCKFKKNVQTRRFLSPKDLRGMAKIGFRFDRFCFEIFFIALNYFCYLFLFVLFVTFFCCFWVIFVIVCFFFAIFCFCLFFFVTAYRFVLPIIDELSLSFIVISSILILITNLLYKSKMIKTQLDIETNMITYNQLKSNNVFNKNQMWQLWQCCKKIVDLNSKIG